MVQYIVGLIVKNGGFEERRISPELQSQGTKKEGRTDGDLLKSNHFIQSLKLRF